ncbi:MAG: NAD-dependent protein deacylase [Alphaproteobacteria bacterium]|nr:MAG: NAD-dependent protein deacylase [Alphaproteobacteria bacterium]
MVAYRNIVVLTGAGISAESGLRTFRDAGGLWEGFRMEDVATPEAFARDPALVQRFYNMRRADLLWAEPNAAHKALAELEANFAGEVTIITQNVDDLHEKAGSHNVMHMHGELRKVRCRMCGQVHDWEDDIEDGSGCADCGTIGMLRPHIVWFGEMPFYMEEIVDALRGCDLFLSIGTSGHVYPAAGFVAEVRAQGLAHTVELNMEPSQGASYFAECRHGPAGSLVPGFVSELLNGRMIE